MSDGRNGGAPAAASRREGARVVVVAEPGSYAQQHAAELLDRADRALGQILRLLKLPDEILIRPRKLIVRAGDAIRDPRHPDQVLSSGSVSDLGSAVVSTVWGPRSHGSGLAEQLARVVLDRVTAGQADERLGRDAQVGGAEVQRFFVEGIARYLAHQIHQPEPQTLRMEGGLELGPTDPNPEQRVSERVHDSERRCCEAAEGNKWRLPLYESMLRGPAADLDPAVYAAMQEAFGAYLFERDGPREFLRFLNGARTDPNRSAELVYGKSLELLEAEWLAGLRRGTGRQLISVWHFMRQTWPYIRPYPWRLSECLALIFLSSILIQITPFQFRSLIDLLTLDETRANPWGYGLVQASYILGVIVFVGLLSSLAQTRLIYVVQILGQNVLRDLRLRYLDRVNTLGAGYFARIQTGDLMARFTSDMAGLADPLARTIPYIAFYLVLIPITMVSMILMSWQLTLMLLLIVPIYTWVTVSFGPLLQRANRSRQERRAQLNSCLEEVVYAHPMIKIFNLQGHVHRRMYPEIHEFRRVEIRADFLRQVFDEVTDWVDLIQVRLVLLGATVLILAQYDPAVSAVIGFITIGTLTGFNILMSRFVAPISRLASIYAGIAYVSAALRRIEEVIHQEPEEMGVPENGTAEPPAVREGISFERVEFAYGTEPVLRDVSLMISAGTSAAFVGPTGAGKTTLVNMIPRFYDPSSGSVRIDGRDVREHALPALRSRIALVSQETFLFNTTIRENVTMGKLDATDEEIVAAARAARIHDFIMCLPAGYDTIVGERGTRLSGGQRQRLAIARALLRDAPILILDEATSALDAETEAEILDTLDEVTRGRTTISITHRLALAMRADKIYALAEGRVIESGTHDELMGRRGLYRKLFDDQNAALIRGTVPGSNGAAKVGAPIQPVASLD